MIRANPDDAASDGEERACVEFARTHINGITDNPIRTSPLPVYAVS